jgi:hypothetical protein
LDLLPDLSVVLAVRDATPLLRESVRRLVARDAGRPIELLLACAGEAPAARLRELFPAARVVAGPPGALTPRLWGLGIERARAPWIALGIGDCAPAGDWLDVVREQVALHSDVAGFGGPIAPPVAGGGRLWAVFFLRYSGYLATPGGAAEEIPGDNAVYRRDDLERSWRDRGDGFWEVLFHRSLRAAGREIRFVPELRTRLATAPTLSRMTVERFRHGFHFGSTRPLAPARRLLAAVASPALMPLLLFRLSRRQASLRPEWRGRWRLAFPALLVLLAGWSCGESLGYLAPRRRAPS